MPLFDMIFVGGVVLAFSSLIAVLAYGVHQTKDLPMTAAPAKASLPKEAKAVPIAAIFEPSVNS